MKKHVEPRPYAARKLVQLAASIEPVQEGRIHIEKINAPFPFTLGSEFGARIRYAVSMPLSDLPRLRRASQS
ncbi:hypothetical protein E4K65_43775 [Bradyrhizobium niftali]|uniref:Uncharacterized protein n=1 Tax=Bradyrhizobium niftali TaxID=2560055 RepID=A0A4Y9L203_9BRAD|nr:hypothetical protein [Bradyrhizobium niftali]TFV37415.1 hypothetical protein E4K65_43775 [Bradyrhizobium niftali]